MPKGLSAAFLHDAGWQPEGRSEGARPSAGSPSLCGSRGQAGKEAGKAPETPEMPPNLYKLATACPSHQYMINMGSKKV